MKRQLLAAALAASVTAVHADPAVLYGTITMEDGRALTGVISWDDEENYWIQHFNGRSRDPVDLAGLDEATRDAILERQPGPQIELGDVTIELVKWFSEPELRPTAFAVEFGAIERMDFADGGVTVRLRDGSALATSGGSNDIGADLRVLSADGSERELDWDDVRQIVFAPAPAGHRTFPPQLFATAETAHGRFRGVIAWDSDERFATEMLDGEIDGEDVSLEFGEVVSIEPRGEAALVVARDGRELLLDGSNDVNSENRGLILVGPDHGRIDVVWEELDRLTLEPLEPGFLPGRAAWAGLGPLRGTVVTADGERRGELLYDIDEARQSDVLDGYLGESRAWIPLRLVQAVTRGEAGSTVTLVDGRAWDLDRSRDVADSNNGIVVTANGARRYVPWEQVERVRFEAPGRR